MLAAHEGQVGHPHGTGLDVGVVVVPVGGAGALGVAVVGTPFGGVTGRGLIFLHLGRRAACLALAFGAVAQCAWCFLAAVE